MILTLFAILLISVTNAKMQAHLPFAQYCTYYGYPVEQHIIHTDDGYNLKYFRIQNKNSNIVSGKKVIYLQHGLFDSSDTWITNSQKYAPGFYFANLGYDVWLGNSRGNHYSNKQLNPKVKNFWNFSFDEMAQYDLPAAMLYINKVTNRRIHYVGHSQGTLIMFIALSSKYYGVQQTLHSYSALGPVVYLKNINSKLLRRLSATPLDKILKNLGVKQILLLSFKNLKINSQICLIDSYICTSLLKQISQMNNSVNNIHRLPVIMGHFPAGSSVKNLQHFQQYIRKENFNKYDYGTKGNQLHYNSTAPPVYHLEQINFPCHLFVGEYDRLANVKDSQHIFNNLTNSPNSTMTKLKYGHATFIWGKNNTHLQQIQAIIEAAEPQSSAIYPQIT